MDFTHHCAFRPVRDDRPRGSRHSHEKSLVDAYRTAVWCFSLYVHLRASDHTEARSAWKRLAGFFKEMTSEVGEDQPDVDRVPGWAVVFRLLLEELEVDVIDREFHRLACAFVDCSILHASGACDTDDESHDVMISALSQIAASLAAKRQGEIYRANAA